jgi:uncharacterized membrane protein YhhN
MSFILIAFVLAILDWFAIAKGWQRVKYIATPAVMAALLSWITMNGGLQGPMRWFALGLLFSLFGDILLMLPKDFFLAGVVSFALAQTTYTYGFNTEGIVIDIAVVILIIIISIMSYQILRKLSAGLNFRGLIELRIPVIIYAILISLMLLSALVTFIRPGWRLSEAMLSSAGAMLFVISDSLLSWDRFVAPITNARTIVMVTYHLGQFGIILGTGIHFLT